jgi:hypothetical protein
VFLSYSHICWTFSHTLAASQSLCPHCGVAPALSPVISPAPLTPKSGLLSVLCSRCILVRWKSLQLRTVFGSWHGLAFEKGRLGMIVTSYNELGSWLVNTWARFFKRGVVNGYSLVSCYGLRLGVSRVIINSRQTQSSTMHLSSTLSNPTN